MQQPAIGTAQANATCVLLLLLPQTTVREVMSSPPVACRANATVRGEALMLLLLLLFSYHRAVYMRSVRRPVGSTALSYMVRAVAFQNP
jgi:hypothetical protein